MITATKGLLAQYCRLIDEMKPGERLTIDADDLRDIQPREYNGEVFTPPDRILENIVGSSFTHSYDASPCGRYVTFFRHADTGKRHYMSPDQRGRHEGGAS